MAARILAFASTLWLVRTALAACVLVGVMGVLNPVLAAKRINLYDPEGRHVGHAMVDHRAGRVDYYDLRERRIGWGHVKSLSERYRVDLFAADGLPMGYAIVDPDTGRVEFFNRSSRLIGSGSLDKKGRVTRFDLSGRRRSDTVLPVQYLRPALPEQPSD